MTVRSARTHFSNLESARSTVLEKARECSDLTIPGLIPYDGQSDSTLLEQPYQSLGARGVNNLTSKLMLALFPPGSPFFRYYIDDKVTAGQPKDVLMQVRNELAKVESKAALKAESARSAIWQFLLHLVVGGNAIYHTPLKGDPQVFGIHQFVVRRAPDGRPMEAIIKEQVFPQSLPEEALTAAKINLATARTDQTVDVYTVIEWSETKVKWWQEVADVVVGQPSETPLDNNPWIVSRWKARPGRSYGDSHVMENLGDLMSFEGLSKAVFEFAEVAAKVIFLDKPSSQTDINELRKAKSGDFVQGQLADLDVLQLDKYADFQVVDSVMQRLERRIAEAFLLTSGTIRDAERVTAEEIRAVAQELEDALGGVYTILASEFQLPFTKRLLFLMRRAGEIPALPKDAAKPVVVTGFDALGRAHSNNRVRALIMDARNLLGDAVLEYFDQSSVLSRLGAGYGVEDLEELLLSEEQVQQNQQAAMANQAAMQAAPGLAQSALGEGA